MRRSLVFVLTLIFVFAMFAGPAAPRADAVVVSSIVVGTVLAAMAAAGIGLTVSGMTASQLSDWVGDKLGSWATSLGGSVEDHINGNLITTTGAGIISVGTAAADGITNFINWLKQDQSLTDNNSVSVIQSTMLINGYYAYPVNPRITSGSRYYEVRNNSQPVYCFPYKGGAGGIPNCYLLFVSNGSFEWMYSYRPLEWYNSRVYEDTIYYRVSNADVLPPDAQRNEVVDYGIILSSLKSSFQVTQSPGLVIDTGTITVPTIDTSSQDKWFLDVGAVPGSTIETVTDGVIADTIEGDLTASGEVAEEEPEFVVDGPIAVSGLTEVFPFCIPFDIYALLSSLSADPQTPVFTARFVVPGIIDQEFTIDLTPFNAVAQIVRTMELLAFIIGLALVTRERFLRS